MREGWEIKTLGDVCDLFNGSTPLRSKKEYWENGSINWFTVDDIRKQGRIINYTIQKITDLGLKNSSLKVLPKKSVLLCCTASVGEYALTNIELTTNQQFNGLVVKNNKKLLPEYLYYFSSTLKHRLLDVSGKTTIDFVSMTKVRLIEIPIAPLQEQQQIVAILDQAFEAIDQAKANIEKNIENAKELFQSKLNAIFSQKGDGWEEKSLGEICNETKNIKWQDFPEQEFQYVDLSSVSRETLSIAETAIINKSNAPSRAQKILHAGDVIFATTRPTLKRATIIEEKLSGHICSTGFVVLRPKNTSSDWIFLFLLTTTFMERMESLQRGASYPAVSDSDVKKSILSVPKSEIVEKEIVLKMRKLQKDIDKIIYQYQIKLTNLEDLKKSILQKAFAGELTNKDVLQQVAEPKATYSKN